MTSPQPKPVPPLYTVYILRSTVRHASLYIGSTPNPPRRLKQHNGMSKGGAARTSRTSLRPWEMVGLVSGFPGMVAALKFEWALTNPHLSLHIPSASRLTIATQRKRNGHPKRPRHSITSILSNLHLLLRVPTFARWPLALHFFSPDVHKAWQRWCATADDELRPSIPVHVDFGGSRSDNIDAAQKEKTMPASDSDSDDDNDDDDNLSSNDEASSDSSSISTPQHGIHALPLDYTPLKPYIAKAADIFAFEREGNCVVCSEELPPQEGIYAVCPNEGCEGVGHLICWNRHFMLQEDDDEEAILPIKGNCPSCGGKVEWGDMMRELTLRMRGAKGEVEKILGRKKERKKRKDAGVKKTVTAKGKETSAKGKGKGDGG